MLTNGILNRTRYWFVSVMLVIGSYSTAFGSAICAANFSPSVIANTSFFGDLPQSEQDAIVQNSEDAAFEAIRKSALTGEQAAREVSKWYDKLRARQLNGEKLTALEHTAILHILRTDFLRFHPDKTLTASMTTTLAISWEALTGKRISKADVLIARLPSSVLRSTTHEVRQFHFATFNLQNPNSKTPGARFTFIRDYVGNFRDTVVALGLVAIAFTQTGSEVLGAAVTGATIGIIAEYIIHRYISHASPKMRETYEKMGWFGQVLLREWYSHHIMHHGSLPDYFNIDSMDIEKIEAKLLEKRPDLPLEKVRERRHGLLINRSAALQIALIQMPFSVATAYFMGFDVISLGFPVAVLSSFGYIAHVNYVHEAIHSTEEKALSTANPIDRLFLTSRYFAFIQRFHYVHHRAPNRNFNVTPGFDWLFGTYRRITVKELMAIKDAGGIF